MTLCDATLHIQRPHIQLEIVFASVRHNHSHSYNRKHSIEAGLQFQRLSPLSWWEAWQPTDAHGAGVLHLGPQAAGRKETWGLGWALETPKPTNSGPLPPTRPHLLILVT